MAPTHERHEHDPIRVIDDLTVDEAGRPAAWLWHLECYHCGQPLPYPQPKLGGGGIVTAPSAPDQAGVLVVQVDPHELLVDRNIRTDTRLTREFVADIAERGVRVPIVATPPATGSCGCGSGHRRTPAAIEARRATVPVLIEDVDGDEVGRSWTSTPRTTSAPP